MFQRVMYQYSFCHLFRYVIFSAKIVLFFQTAKENNKKKKSTQVRISDLGMYYTLLYTYSRVHYYMSLYVFLT